MASVGDHPETDIQALDDDSDACAQSLDDDSDEDVQQLDDDNDEEHLSRWQANFQTSPQACHPKGQELDGHGRPTTKGRWRRLRTCSWL
jgi:hypothetical protein